jgi:hypothetical protein
MFSNVFAHSLAIVNIIAIEFPQTIPFDHDRVYKYFFLLNFPAYFLDHGLLGEFVQGLLVLPFAYIQWILIGWVARSAARWIEEHRLKLS